MISDAAEAAAGRINTLFAEVLGVPLRDRKEALAALDRIRADNSHTLRPFLPARYDAAFAQASEIVAQAFGEDGQAILIADERPPLLLYSMRDYNLVAHRARFFAIPQSLGPIDLQREDVSGMPGVLTAANLQQLEAQLELAIKATLQ